MSCKQDTWIKQKWISLKYQQHDTLEIRSIDTLLLQWWQFWWLTVCQASLSPSVKGRNLFSRSWFFPVRENLFTDGKYFWQSDLPCVAIPFNLISSFRGYWKEKESSFLCWGVICLGVSMVIVLYISGHVLVSIGKENLVFQGSPFSYYGVQALSKFIYIAPFWQWKIFEHHNVLKSVIVMFSVNAVARR